MISSFSIWNLRMRSTIFFKGCKRQRPLLKMWQATFLLELDMCNSAWHKHKALLETGAWLSFYKKFYCFPKWNCPIQKSTLYQETWLFTYHIFDNLILAIMLLYFQEMITEVHNIKSTVLTQKDNDHTASPVKSVTKTLPIIRDVKYYQHIHSLYTCQRKLQIEYAYRTTIKMNVKRVNTGGSNNNLSNI